MALHSTIDKMSFGCDSTARKGDSDREVKGDSTVSRPKGCHFVCAYSVKLGDRCRFMVSSFITFHYVIFGLTRIQS